MHVTGLIDDYKDLIHHFNKEEYPVCFARYKEACAPFFDALSAEDITAECSLLLDHVDARCKEKRFSFRQKALREEYKQLLLFFLVPCAIDHGTKNARTFADEVVAHWNGRYPDEVVHAGTYEDLLAGFRSLLSIFGF